MANINSIRAIKLKQGSIVIIDAEDYDLISQWKWHYNNGYAARVIRDKDKKLLKIIWMHRIINRTPDGMETDHVNGDPLDNRKSNLRSCTHAQNLRNQRAQKNRSSKYRGVVFDKENKKWRALIKLSGKRYCLGRYLSEHDAAIAYNKAALNLFEEFAYQNIISA
jgi:hypothetical protein